MGFLPVDEVRLTRDALRYGFAVGKVRVLEAKILDRSAFERLVDSPTFAEQKRLLSETVYGRYIEAATTAEEVEAGLEQALEDFYSFLGQATLPEPVSRFFRTRYDYMNLKAALKAQLLDAPLEGLLVDHGTVPREAFAGDLEGLPAPLADVAEKVLGATASDDAAAHAEPAAVDTAAIDAAVDQAMFNELKRLARESRSRFLVELAAGAVDIANVKTLMRSAMVDRDADETAGALLVGGSVPVDALAPLAGLAPADVAAGLARFRELKGFSAGDIEDAGRIDVELDAVTAAALVRGRRADVGSEPVIAYVMAREAEVASVRMLLLGRLSGLNNETLRSRLRASYR